MIIVEEDSQLRVITQPDHAHFAAQLLALWRLDGLPDHPRRDSLLFAIREHDNGWREADAAPWIDPERHRPYDFRSYPDAARLEIWSRGIQRFAGARPYVALLIAEHARAVHLPLSGEWNRYFDHLEPQRQEWLEAAAAESRALQDDYRFLRLADTLSLAVCCRWSEPFECCGVTGLVGEGRLSLEPFPFAGTTTFQVQVRRIPDRPYHRDTDIGRELAAARWQGMSVRVLPA